MDANIHFIWIRSLFIIIMIVSFIFIIKYTLVFIYPFIVAVLIAFLLNPIITYLQTSWKLNRTIATLLMMCGFFIFMFTAGFFGFKRLMKESSMLVDTLPVQLQQLKALLADIGQTFLLPIYETIIDYVPFFPMIDELSFTHYLETLIDDVGQSSLTILSNFIGTASDIVSSITYIIVIFFFILLASVMMTKDFEFLKTTFTSLFSDKVLQKFMQIKQNIKKSLFGFIKAQIMLTFISSLIVFVGLSILKVDHLFMMTLIIFFVDFIPYVGIGVVFIPWMMYHFFMNQFILTIQLTILYIIVIIVRQVIEPKILASSIGIHPLIALFILFIGIQSLGILGIVVTPIILILLSAMYHASIFHLLWHYVKHGSS